MITGYTRPLYLLPFDHRASYISGLFMRRKSCHLNQNQLALSPQKTARLAELVFPDGSRWMKPGSYVSRCSWNLTKKPPPSCI